MKYFATAYVIIMFFFLIMWIIRRIKNASKLTRESSHISSNLHEISTPLVRSPQIIDQPDTFATEKQERDTWIKNEITLFDNSPSLKSLIQLKELGEIRYGDLLTCIEWKFKRLKILMRDRYTCKDCGKRMISNHVHHTYYLLNKAPWDIENSALDTLCYECHSNRHLKEKISTYKIVKGNLIYVSQEQLYCSRCGGTSYLPQYYYYHRGICFKCMGDLLSRNIFKKILIETKKNLHLYDDEQLRNQYRSYIKRISVQDFIKKLPSSAIPSVIRSVNTSEESLPF